MKRSPIQILVSMGSERQDSDETRGIPREPVEGGGAIVRQWFDESKLSSARVTIVGKGFGGRDDMSRRRIMCEF